jgi:glutamate-1-semialdehyde 2,1-aminomutase
MSATLPSADRVAALMERERTRYRERTARSSEYFSRAGEVMPAACRRSSRRTIRGRCTSSAGGRARVGRGRQRVPGLPQRLRRDVRRAREPDDRRGREGADGLGTHFAAPTEGSILVAEELRRRWGLPQWRFTNSGTESTMDAIHLARGLTGRDVIVKIEGTYHGHHDA